MTYEELFDFCARNNIFIDTKEKADLEEFRSILYHLKPGVEMKYLLDKYRNGYPYAHPGEYSDGMWSLWTRASDNLWSVKKLRAELQDAEAQEEDIQPPALEDVL